jgi:two-component system sensor histidine kinase DegS
MATAEAATRPQGGVGRLRSELEGDITKIEREISEIDQLMEQVLIEIGRHETRRERIGAQLEALEQLAEPDPDEIREARNDLMSITRRELLFDSQRQVLEGKHRVLARFLQRLVEIDNSLATMTGGVQERPAPQASSGLRALADASPSIAAGAMAPAAQIRSQEDLRRDIVRALHDGPAQSIANIGLQTEVIEHLVTRRDGRAIDELEALRRLVQLALDTTKEFIFEVRPMVLDDLGLGPTLRRACADRSRREELPIELETLGIEQRLSTDLESGIFRGLDEAIAGFADLRPPSVHVTMDWSGRELQATVAGGWGRSGDESIDVASGSPGRPGDTPAYLLAMMEEKRSEEREALTVARSLAPARLADMQSRASAMGIRMNVRDEGQVIEFTAPISR